MDIDCDRLPAVLEATPRHASRSDLASFLDWCGAHQGRIRTLPCRRKAICDGVYTSTEYPPHVLMPCHNELSHTREWVSLIFFYCAIAPVDRGETPLVDGRRVPRRMRPAAVAAFEEILENNVRVLDDSGYPSSVSWQYTYGTMDEAQVEAKAREVDAGMASPHGAVTSSGDLTGGSWS